MEHRVELKSQKTRVQHGKINKLMGWHFLRITSDCKTKSVAHMQLNTEVAYKKKVYIAEKPNFFLYTTRPWHLCCAL